MVSLEYRTKDSIVYNPPNYPKSKPPKGLVSFKESENWCIGIRSAKTLRLFPYIDKKGRIHATSVCSWKCSSPQLFASICSTVFKRLMGKYKHYHYKARPRPNDLFKIAVIYSITNDDYWFQRTEELLKRRPTVVEHLYSRKMKLDDNTKVLYDQALKNALWFQSRAKRSTRCRVSCPQSTFVVSDGRPQRQKAPQSSVTDYSINKMVKDWAKVYTPSSSQRHNVL